jgi:hypothetical protein
VVNKGGFSRGIAIKEGEMRGFKRSEIHLESAEERLKA